MERKYHTPRLYPGKGVPMVRKGTGFVHAGELPSSSDEEQEHASALSWEFRTVRVYAKHWRFCGKLHRGKTAIQEARCKPQSLSSLAALTVARLQGKLANAYQACTCMVLLEGDYFYSLCNTDYT